MFPQAHAGGVTEFMVNCIVDFDWYADINFKENLPWQEMDYIQGIGRHIKMDSICDCGFIYDFYLHN